MLCTALAERDSTRLGGDQLVAGQVARTSTRLLPEGSQGEEERPDFLANFAVPLLQVVQSQMHFSWG